VYAFDADDSSCNPLWKMSVVPPNEQVIAAPSPQNPNALIVPTVGVTGTPVADLGASLLYVVSAAQITALNPTYDHHLYALDLATGSIVQSSGFFYFLAGQFDSAVQLQRSALLLDDGSVYVAFGSNGAPGDYHGWLFKLDAPSLQSPEYFSTTPLPVSNSIGGGGIWQSGGGPSADKNHNVFVTTGIGPFNADRSAGSLSYGDSFLQFGPSSIASVADYFTPCNQLADEVAGEDVGASAPLVLPDGIGPPSRPNVLIGGSKSGALYVVDRDQGQMGGYSPSPCPDSTSRTQTIPQLGAGGPILSTPLYWNGAVYVAPGNGNLLSLPMTQGILSSTPSSTSAIAGGLGPQGATPALSWDEAPKDPSTAVIWLIDTAVR